MPRCIGLQSSPCIKWWIVEWCHTSRCPVFYGIFEFKIEAHPLGRGTLWIIMHTAQRHVWLIENSCTKRSSINVRVRIYAHTAMTVCLYAHCTTLRQCQSTLAASICCSPWLITQTYTLNMDRYSDVITCHGGSDAINNNLRTFFNPRTTEKLSDLNKGRYRQVSNISRTLIGNNIVDNSDVVGAAPMLQLHLHYRLNTWLQWIGHKQLQDETRII